MHAFTGTRASVIALLLSACGQLSPPPTHPTIEGDWPSVSQAEIQTALALVRDYYVRLGSSPPAPYRVVVTDRNHMKVCWYLSTHIETCDVVERVRGKWQLAQYSTIQGPGI